MIKKASLHPKPAIVKRKLPSRPDLRGLGRGFGTGAGWPSVYREAYCRIVYKLRLLGISIENIADVLELNPEVLVQWRYKYPEFKAAWERGSALADAKVARSLFGRAMGYKHEAEKIFNHKGKIIRVPYTERYPPDTGAIEFWLTNRQPEHWKRRSAQEITGANGSKLYPPTTLVFDFSGQDVPTIEGHRVESEDAPD